MSWFKLGFWTLLHRHVLHEIVDYTRYVARKQDDHVRVTWILKVTMRVPSKVLDNNSLASPVPFKSRESPNVSSGTPTSGQTNKE